MCWVHGRNNESAFDMSIDITGRSALQLAALIQSGAVDPIDVAETTLAAIEACEDKAVFTRVTVPKSALTTYATPRRTSMSAG